MLVRRVESVCKRSAGSSSWDQRSPGTHNFNVLGKFNCGFGHSNGSHTMLRKLTKKWHSAVLALLRQRKVWRWRSGRSIRRSDGFDHGHDQQVAGGGFVSPSEQQYDVELCALVRPIMNATTDTVGLNDLLDGLDGARRRLPRHVERISQLRGASSVSEDQLAQGGVYGSMDSRIGSNSRRLGKVWQQQWHLQLQAKSFAPERRQIMGCPSGPLVSSPRAFAHSCNCVLAQVKVNS